VVSWHHRKSIFTAGFAISVVVTTESLDEL